MLNGKLNPKACEQLIQDYISDEEVVIFVDSRHVVQCLRKDAVAYIDSFMKIGHVRVANLAFTSKVVINPIGVGQGNKCGA
jgi:hypothetical protein